MTRWKRERIADVLRLHAHNHLSMMGERTISAAESLGLPIGFRHEWNCSQDGSLDRVWYTCAAALDRLGGRHAIVQRRWEMEVAS